MFQNDLGVSRRLAAGTLDSILGKLRLIGAEQAGMAVSTSQSVPLFFVLALLREKTTNGESLSRIHKYVLVRDAVLLS